MQDSLLEIENLVVKFYTYEGIVEAIDGVNLDLKDGETLGLVGETGCGKSVTSLSVLVLVPPPGKIEGGKALLRTREGEVDLLGQKEAALRGLRGKDITPIYPISCASEHSCCFPSYIFVGLTFRLSCRRSGITAGEP